MLFSLYFPIRIKEFLGHIHIFLRPFPYGCFKKSELIGTLISSSQGRFDQEECCEMTPLHQKNSRVLVTCWCSQLSYSIILLPSEKKATELEHYSLQIRCCRRRWRVKRKCFETRRVQFESEMHDACLCLICMRRRNLFYTLVRENARYACMDWYKEPECLVRQKWKGSNKNKQSSFHTDTGRIHIF